jgi:hypothetical protein
MNAERSAAIVRRWVGLYTRGLPQEVRESRRAEIDDDLWCQTEDAAISGRTDKSLGDEIVARFVLGIPADVSWRVDQIRQAKPATRGRRITMHAPGRAFLAIIGGIGWVVWPIPQAIVGRDWPSEGMMPWLLMLSVVGGTWTLAGATAGLALDAQDRVRATVAAFAAICALIGAISVFGPFGLIVALPLGSAALLWELGRSGTVGPWLSRVHVASAILVLVVFAAMFLNPEILKTTPTPESTALSIAVMSLVFPYAVTWIAIGWALWRGESVPQGTPAGA